MAYYDMSAYVDPKLAHYELNTTRVALTGGTGDLGPAIVDAVLSAGFRLTVFTRVLGKPVDSRAKIRHVDYSSLDALTEAFRDFDVVINTISIGQTPLSLHLRLAEAAQRAGVSRYIPSEFGCNSANPLTAQLAVSIDKIAVVNLLRRLANEHTNFSWSALITGPCIDYGLDRGFLLNLRDLGTEVYDGGDVPFSTSTMDGVGLAVVGILKHLEETKNRYVYSSEAEVTQNQLLQLSGTGIVPIPVFSQTLQKRADMALDRRPPDLGTASVSMIKLAIFGGRFGAVFTNSEHELLGVPRLSESQIKDIVKRASKRYL